MKLWAYIKDKLASLSIVAVGVAAIALILFVFDLDYGAIIFVCLFVIAIVLAAFSIDYLKRRRFYNALASTLEQLQEANLICELLQRPDFLEGELAFDALRVATKTMNDNIASYRISSEEYREYIETWVHEIKTPIAAAHLIAQNHPGKAIQSMDNEISHVEAYVEQALYYSRSSALQNDYHIKELALEPLVKEAVKRNARLLIENQVKLEFGPLDFRVYTDAKWICFILGQLIGNAVKYKQPDGDAPALISFTAQQLDTGLDSAHIILSVRDNGIGIPQEDLSRVFDKGFTGVNGRRYAKSTGIGLYLCKQLCTKMGLGITIDSVNQDGCVVQICFPQNKLYFLLG